MHEGIRAALDSGNSLDLRVWADALEEQGELDKAAIVRWLAEWKRRPRLKISGRYLPDTPVFSYYWMTQYCYWTKEKAWAIAVEGSSEHCLPRVGKTTLPITTTTAEAYLEAVQYLTNGGFAERIR